MAASPINDLEIVNEVKLLTVGEHLGMREEESLVVMSMIEQSWC